MPETTLPVTGNVTTVGPAPVPVTTTAPRESLGQRVGDFFHRADADVTTLLAKAPGIESAVRDHAGVVFTVASEFLALAQLADPALAPELATVSAALAALEPKVLALVQSAAVITGQLSSPANPS